MSDCPGLFGADAANRGEDMRRCGAEADEDVVS